MQNTRVMLLKSIDGQEYTLALIVPVDLTEQQAVTRAEDAIRKGQASNPEEWGFSDIKPFLVEAGFEIPDVFDGPCWDETRNYDL